MEEINQGKYDNFQEGRKGAFQRKNISGVCVINPGDLEDSLRCRSREMHSVVHVLENWSESISASILCLIEPG